MGHLCGLAGYMDALLDGCLKFLECFIASRFLTEDFPLRNLALSALALRGLSELSGNSGQLRSR